MGNLVYYRLRGSGLDAEATGACESGLDACRGGSDERRSEAATVDQARGGARRRGTTTQAERWSRVVARSDAAAEQIRLAALEKAYAERVRELTKREMQSELALARLMWERAREEVDRAEWWSSGRLNIF
ncbi:hypothetical protein U1Q18_007844 [Sarracenia purpurea var. burkii]